MMSRSVDGKKPMDFYHQRSVVKGNTQFVLWSLQVVFPVNGLLEGKIQRNWYLWTIKSYKGAKFSTVNLPSNSRFLTGYGHGTLESFGITMNTYQHLCCHKPKKKHTKIIEFLNSLKIWDNMAIICDLFQLPTVQKPSRAVTHGPRRQPRLQPQNFNVSPRFRRETWFSDGGNMRKHEETWGNYGIFLHIFTGFSRFSQVSQESDEVFFYGLV